MNSTINYYHVVPWRNPEQFCKVYKCLYSKSITDRRWAVDQVSVWETRCHPALPTAIEATVALVRGEIQDTLFQVERSFSQASDIQMLYSMALVRYVNLVMEVDEVTPNAIRRTELAKMRNIPSWIVDLRHQCAHSFPPSLPALRIAVRTALEHLEDMFWKIEAADIHLIVNKPPTAEQEIDALIATYKKIQYARREEAEFSLELKNDLRHVIRKLRKHIHCGRMEMFLQCLLKPEVFISREDLIKILKKAASLYMQYEISIPKHLCEFWIPIIKFLHEYDMIPRFIEKMMLSQELCHIPACNKLSAAWSKQLLLAPSTDSFSEKLNNVFKQKGVLFDYYRLLHACMRAGNSFFLTIFQLLTAKLGNSDLFSQLFCIFLLAQGKLVQKEPAEPPRLGPRPASKKAKEEMKQELVLTVEDGEEDLNEQKARRKRMRRNDNIWSFAPIGMEWGEMPLGTILNPASETEEKEPAKPEVKMLVIKDEPTSYIVANESDNEETTVEETMDTLREPDIPEMIYIRKQL